MITSEAEAIEAYGLMRALLIEESVQNFIGNHELARFAGEMYDALEFEVSEWQTSQILHLQDPEIGG